MPPLLAGALISVAATAGVTLGTTAAAVLAYGITTIATIGAQFALNKLTRKPREKGDPQFNQLTIRQATPVRTRIYGRVKTSGALFIEIAAPFEHANLVLGIVICEGPIDAMEEWWLNDTWSTSVGSSNVSLPWGALIVHDFRLGSDTQTASALYTPYGYTGQLKGLAWTGIICIQPPIPIKQFQFYYPNGIPTIRVVARGAKVYHQGQDWNTPSTWTWTRNPAWIVLDYLTYAKIDASGTRVPRGMGLPKTRMNVASFQAFANICDESIVTRFTFDGFGNVLDVPGTEPRYSCDGMYDMSQAPADVLNRLLETCDAHLFTMNDGTVGIRGGKWEVPTVTIDDSMILSADLTQGNEKYTVVNQFKITVTAPHCDYQQVEGEPYDDGDNQDINGVLAEDLSLPFVQSYSQARRLAKILMAKRNPRWRFNSLVCTLGALDALGEQFIHVTYSPGGTPLIDDDFMILNFKLNGNQVELQLASLDAEAYDWNGMTEDAVPPTTGSSPDTGGADPTGGGTIITGGGG
jgi:hypothetical protein